MSVEHVTCPKCDGRGWITRKKGGRPRELPQATRDLIVEWSRTMPLRVVARRLEDEGIPTARGGRWYDTTVREVLKSEGLR